MSDAGPGRDPVELALDALDAINADGPETVLVDGETRPKEVLHSERMTHWLAVLAPDASDAQRLAARGHHLRRWISPRTSYPEGRVGYHKWRTDQKERQAREVGEVLAGVGVAPDVIERVRTIVAKQGLGRDPDVQTHEDALCLTFIELQFDEVAERLGDDHMIEVVRRTARKMSPAGLDAVGQIELSERGQRLLAAALADPRPSARR